MSILHAYDTDGWLHIVKLVVAYKRRDAAVSHADPTNA